FQKANDQFGSVDGLANILGIAQSATPIEEVTFDQYHQLMDINIGSVFLTCREAAKYMKAQENGRIVNVGSVATTRPRPGLQAYVASKGAVETFSKALALELASNHINVNVLHPGPADTSMLGEFSGEGKNVAEDRKEIFEKSVPLGKLLQPNNIADAVAFLLSDEAEMITGMFLYVEGERKIEQRKGGGGLENHQMYMKGTWTKGSGTQTIDVLNPANSEVSATIPRGTKKDINDAVAAAREAFNQEEWKQVKPFERGEILFAISEKMKQERDELATLEATDVGKPLTQAYADVDAAIRYFRFYGGAADKVM